MIFTIAGVGTATVIGSAIGLIWQKQNKGKIYLLGASAGLMLGACVLGLFQPALELTDHKNLWMLILGMTSGCLFLEWIEQQVIRTKRLYKGMGIVFAIAIHNFPEGIAAGVAAGAQEMESAWIAILGIMIQNVPEGIVMIEPLQKNGFSKKKSFGICMIIAMIEVFGTIAGGILISFWKELLVFMLSFAGGAMMYVILGEMTDEIQEQLEKKRALHAMLFCYMLMMSIQRIFSK